MKWNSYVSGDESSKSFVIYTAKFKYMEASVKKFLS